MTTQFAMASLNSDAYRPHGNKKKSAARLGNLIQNKRPAAVAFQVEDLIPARPDDSIHPAQNMSELPRDNDADDGNNDEINDPSAWIVLDCVEADELNENEDASAEILGVSKSEMLCLPCSRDSVRNFRKAYRIRGNNAGVRGFGTLKSTFYRKKTL